MPILIGAGVFGTGNLVVHAINGDVHNFGDAMKFFGQGALTGAALGAAWQFAPLIPGVGQAIQTGMNIYGAVQLGGLGISTFNGVTRGMHTGDWSGVGNAFKIFLGNFNLDENSFFGGAWQGFSRHTWEFIQSGLGNTFAQIRNAIGEVDNVEYFGGSTLVNRNNPGHGGGMTLGSVILGTNLEASTDDWTFMHEFGHTIQSRILGPGYGLFVAPVSGMDMLLGGRQSWSTNPYYSRHDIRWYERQANRYAASYFGNPFNVKWNDERNPRWIPPYEYKHRERASVLTLY